jgi:hypothetical protein
MIERVTEADSGADKSRPMGVWYPPQFYWLSHVALPSPVSDALYGRGACAHGASSGTKRHAVRVGCSIASLDVFHFCLVKSFGNPAGDEKERPR